MPIITLHRAWRSGLSRQTRPLPGVKGLGLFTQDRVLRGLGNAELHHAFGRDLNLLTSGGVAADTGLAVDQDDLAQPRDGEGVLGVLVRQRHEGFDGLKGLLLGQADGFRHRGGDL